MFENALICGRRSGSISRGGMFSVKSVIIVRQGYEYTIERFGKYSTTFRPGFHVMIPFVNRDRAAREHDGACSGCTITGGHLQR